MIIFVVDKNKANIDVRGTRILVASEELTAIDILRDNIAEQLITSREKATEMIIESLTDSLSDKE